MKNKILRLTRATTFISILALSVNGQTNTEQNVKRKFIEYITPRLDGRELKLKLFIGDINGDGLTDYLISYCVQATEQDKEAGGGNAAANLVCMQDGIAVYINTGNDYILKAEKSMDNFKEYSASEVSFEVKGIINGKIVCESTAYGADDPRCCPSVIKKTYVMYENGKLVKM